MTNKKSIKLLQQENQRIQEWMNRENPNVCFDGFYGYIEGCYLSYTYASYEIRVLSFDGKIYKSCNFGNLKEFLSINNTTIFDHKLFRIAMQ